MYVWQNCFLFLGRIEKEDSNWYSVIHFFPFLTKNHSDFSVNLDIIKKETVCEIWK